MRYDGYIADFNEEDTRRRVLRKVKSRNGQNWFDYCSSSESNTQRSMAIGPPAEDFSAIYLNSWNILGRGAFGHRGRAECAVA
jgi:hypothetical protein